MKYLKTFELYQNFYQKTFWSKDNITININQVQSYLNKMNVPIIEVPVKDIEHLCIHLGVKNKETKERSEKSNLGYPIIIVKSGNIYTMIIDGHHRLLKAINHKIATIKARILDLDNAPAEFKEVFKR